MDRGSLQAVVGGMTDFIRHLELEANMEVPREVTEEVIREAGMEVTEEVTEEVSGEVTKEVTKEVNREVTKEVTEEVTRDVTRRENDRKDSLRWSARDQVTEGREPNQMRPTSTGSEIRTRGQILPMSLHTVSSLSSSSALSSSALSSTALSSSALSSSTLSSSALSSSALLCSSDPWVPCWSSRKELMEVLDKMMLEVGEEEESEDQWQMRKIIDLAQ